jgi:hypothetical protein
VYAANVGLGAVARRLLTPGFGRATPAEGFEHLARFFNDHASAPEYLAQPVPLRTVRRLRR